MKFVLTRNLDELSEAFKQQMLMQMYADRSRINIAVTTGTTPEKGYAMLGEFVKDKKCLTMSITTYLMSFGIGMPRQESAGRN